jgi:hypothetical protein
VVVALAQRGIGAWPSALPVQRHVAVMLGAPPVAALDARAAHAVQRDARVARAHRRHRELVELGPRQVVVAGAEGRCSQSARRSSIGHA